MSIPNTPWPDKAESVRRFRQSEKTGHTQLAMKCGDCGLEFVILTWRPGAELAAAFGIYTDIEPIAPADEHRIVDGIPLPKGVPQYTVPDASQVTCPECAKRGDVHMLSYRRAKGPIFRRGD